MGEKEGGGGGAKDSFLRKWGGFKRGAKTTENTNVDTAKNEILSQI